MKEPEVAAGDAGDCGDGLAVGEVGAVPGEAELAVKPPVSQPPQRALAAQVGPGRRGAWSAAIKDLLRL